MSLREERGMWRRRQSESKGRSDPAEKNPSPHSNCCCSVAKLGPTLCDLMDYSLPGASVHGISQTRILERVSISFSRESYQSRDQTHVSCISRWIPYHWAMREAHCHSTIKKKKKKKGINFKSLLVWALFSFSMKWRIGFAQHFLFLRRGFFVFLFFLMWIILKSLLNLLQYCFCFMFLFLFFGLEACGLLTSLPGIEPAPPMLDGGVLTTGPPGKSQNSIS